ncbi:MAG TPA: AMP-binding protein [Candidatus Dormibacteraeota bacterium]|nr:AMP-binding protein [Candidatus Dormibacteraeota bacterium]
MKRYPRSSQWQHQTKEAVLQLQAEKLRRYLRDTVVPFSPYYRELFRRHGLRADSIRSVEDLEQIPFTSKIDLVNTPEHPQRAREFILIPDQATLARRPSTVWQALRHGREHVQKQFEWEFRPIFMTSTTGRSADPVPFLYSNRDLDILSVAGRRVMEVAAAKQEYRLVNLFPYAPHLAFWITHYASTEYGVFSLGTGGGKVMGTDGNLRLIQKIQPDVLIGMPTFLYHVLQHAVEEGMRCESLKRLVLGGEKAAEGIRRKLRNLAAKLGSPRVDVIATYGFTEAKMAWVECPFPIDDSPSGYHLYPDLGIVEVVDPKTGIVVPEGEPGELVFTPLEARGSVVLRYRTGDIIDGGLVYCPCPHCGRVVPRLLGKVSRNSEIKSMQLDKVKGTLVDFNQLEHVLDDAPNVCAWQLEIRKFNNDPMELDELILHVTKLGEAPEEKVARELNNRFLERTEIRPNRIVFHDLSEMRDLLGVGTQLKEQKVIDNRPKKPLDAAMPGSVSGTNSSLRSMPGGSLEIAPNLTGRLDSES